MKTDGKCKVFSVAVAPGKSSTASMALAGDESDANRAPISFPFWKEALATADLAPAVKANHPREIITFLRHCKNAPVPATMMLAKP